MFRKFTFLPFLLTAALFVLPTTAITEQPEAAAYSPAVDSKKQLLATPETSTPYASATVAELVLADDAQVNSNWFLGQFCGFTSPTRGMVQFPFTGSWGGINIGGVAFNRVEFEFDLYSNQLDESSIEGFAWAYPNSIFDDIYFFNDYTGTNGSGVPENSVTVHYSSSHFGSGGFFWSVFGNCTQGF